MVSTLVRSPIYLSPINSVSQSHTQTIPKTNTNTFHKNRRPRNNNLLLSPPLHPSVDPEIVFAGNFAPVDELPPTDCTVVRGSLPPSLNGVYIRNGPNPQHHPLGPLHFFEGDGMLHSLKISHGRATFSSRYVETYKYKLERDAGVPIFPNLLTGIHGIADLLRCGHTVWRVMVGRIDLMKGFGLANTSVSCFANKLVALGESDLPYIIQLTPDGDVKTLGRWDFAGKMFANMTAHPKIDSTTGEAFAFRCSPIFPYLTLFRFDQYGAKDRDVPILSVKQPTLIHDFAVTDRFVVFPETQLVVDASKLAMGQGTPVLSDPKKVPRIGVMPRYATSDTDMKWFQVPDFNAMHIINAWEDGDDHIIIVASNITPIQNILSDIKTTRFSLEKLRVNVKTREVTRNIVSSKSLELGSVNGSYIGKKNRYVYMGLCEHVPKMSGVVKIDLETGREVSRRFYGRNCFGGEPMFVAREEDDTTSLEEDDGYVVSYVHDEDSGESMYLVMDAKSEELDIAAVVKLPGRVPYGFHGIFVSQKRLEQLHL